MTTEPHIIRKDAFTLVGMKIRTTAMSPEIPQLWASFVPRIGEVPLIVEPHVSYGLMENFDPVQGRFDYMAAVAVKGSPQLRDGMVALEVAACTYAVFTTTLANIGSTFAHIYQGWFPNSGFGPADAPQFERYDESFDPTNPNSQIEIYIPLKDLGRQE